MEFEKSLIAWIRKTSQQIEKDAKELREEFQYGTKTNVSGGLLDIMEMQTKDFIYKTEVLLNKLQRESKTRKHFDKR
ncbi:MAG: hypothetical protein V1734_04070 [Nanoarchaeota archaeon]